MGGDPEQPTDVGGGSVPGDHVPVPRGGHGGRSRVLLQLGTSPPTRT